MKKFLSFFLIILIFNSVLYAYIPEPVIKKTKEGIEIKTWDKDLVKPEDFKPVTKEEFFRLQKETTAFHKKAYKELMASDYNRVAAQFADLTNQLARFTALNIVADVKIIFPSKNKKYKGVIYIKPSEVRFDSRDFSVLKRPLSTLVYLKAKNKWFYVNYAFMNKELLPKIKIFNYLLPLTKLIKIGGNFHITYLTPFRNSHIYWLQYKRIKSNLFNYILLKTDLNNKPQGLILLKKSQTGVNPVCIVELSSFKINQPLDKTLFNKK